MLVSTTLHWIFQNIWAYRTVKISVYLFLKTVIFITFFRIFFMVCHWGVLTAKLRCVLKTECCVNQQTMISQFYFRFRPTPIYHITMVLFFTSGLVIKGRDPKLPFNTVFAFHCGAQWRINKGEIWYGLHTVNPLLSHPGGLFIQDTFGKQ